MTSAAIPLRIDIVSDVVCPWCIIGLKQVEKAFGLVGRDLGVETHWHPFQLNPNMPPEGEDTAEHIARKYGSTPEQSRANRQRLSDIGESLGFAFNYGEGMRIYNTFNAHKLLTIFGSERGWQAQTELKMALFKAYFQDRRDVSDIEVLCDIAEAQGMDRAVAAAWIADAALTENVRAEMAHWMDQNITGVPAIIFDQKFMVPGAQSAETFADVINKVLAKRAAA
ncbi:MAG: disulfide bond formation protein DsbA [Sphingomonadaceae bacterium PASS1]|jgi:predicted DsbA family dithiol-disulfide isomerase|nr:MAG: disulfide bond formation protein DsbA [Sphingomonadaceae bacterium PASS1]